jgi:hypothetical protein
MKPIPTIRTLVIALVGYAAALVPMASQAHSVEVSLPGISVRLPAPPLPIIVPPGVIVRNEPVVYDHRPEYRPAPGYYREDWRRERWEHEHRDHHDYRDHDDHRGGDHDHDGWRH